jgi:hypothetical protein
MTRDVGLLRRVGAALLRFQRQPFTLRRWLVAADAFELADPAAAAALYEVRNLRDAAGLSYTESERAGCQMQAEEEVLMSSSFC